MKYAIFDAQNKFLGTIHAVSSEDAVKSFQTMYDASASYAQEMETENHCGHLA